MSMTSRERVLATLAFQKPDRIPRCDAFWEDTLTRWQGEGLPAGVDPNDYFDFDFEAIYLDASLRLPEKLIEETGEYTIREDKLGYTAKQWKGRAGALGYLDHVVKTSQDWQRLKDRLAVDFGGTSRIADFSYFTPFMRYPSWAEMAARFQELRRRQRYILLHVYGPFEATWRKHGFEASLMDLVLDPAFMAEMAQVHTDLVIATLEKARTFGIVPDGLFLVEDMGMNRGPLFSPRAYQQALFPAHHRIGEYLHAHQIAYFMHSDGDIRPLIASILAAGVQVLQPLEAKSRLDLRELMPAYPRQLVWMGNIDVRAMAAGRPALERELRTKLAVARQMGSYIYHSDHSVPPDVSLSQYRYVLELLDRYGVYEHDGSR